MAKPPRKVFHVTLNPVKGGKPWVVQETKKVVSEHDTQAEAESAARGYARLTQAEGGLAQVVFHKADGTIREESTYGEDPRRTPG